MNGLPALLCLVPASDDCAYFLSKYRVELSSAYEVVTPKWEVMETLIDKRRQYEKAQSLGIPIPKTYFPDDIEAVRELAANLKNYPYVIKPLVAHSWRRAAMKSASQGKKGFSVANPQELISRYQHIARSDKQVMSQEVIGGSDERLFTFMSYFDTQSRPIAYCIRKKVRQLPIDFGYCTMTVSCHDKVVKEQSIRLLRGLGYHGLAGVEWKLDPNSGIYKLIEVNARAVNTTAIAPACGVDLPYIAWLDRIDGRAPRVTEWQDGIKWLDWEQDLWAARELHRAGKLGLRQWWRSMGGPKIDAVYAADDIRPFVGQSLSSLKLQATRFWGRRTAAWVRLSAAIGANRAAAAGFRS